MAFFSPSRPRQSGVAFSRHSTLICACDGSMRGTSKQFDGAYAHPKSPDSRAPCWRCSARPALQGQDLRHKAYLVWAAGIGTLSRATVRCDGERRLGQITTTGLSPSGQRVRETTPRRTSTARRPARRSGQRVREGVTAWSCWREKASLVFTAFEYATPLGRPPLL